MPKNVIQHIEWTTSDPKRLRKFFGKVFDWTFHDAMPDYTMIEGVGGIFERPDPQMPIVITPYVNVTDLAAVEKKVKAAGGKIHKSQQEVPGMGSFTLFSDPDGNIVGVWQPMAKRRTAAARKKTKKTSTKRAQPKKRTRAK